MFRFVPFVALVACADAPDEPPPEPGTPPTTEEPGSETVTVSFDVDIYSMFESPKVPSFDTHDGARVLEAMTLAFDHTLSTEVTVQNVSAVDLARGDYVMDHYFNTIAQLGLAEDPYASPPFVGAGSFWLQVDDPLGPQGSGTDTLELTDDETLQYEDRFTPESGPEFLEAMTDAGDVTIVIGGFQEVWFDFDPSLEGSGVQVDWQVPTLRYAGEITVTYEYVPAE